MVPLTNTINILPIPKSLPECAQDIPTDFSRVTPTYRTTENCSPENKYLDGNFLSTNSKSERFNHSVMSSVISKCGFSNWGTPGPAGSGHIPSSQGGIPSSWGRGARTPPPSQATEREAALLHPDPSQNHNIITTTTWDRKPSGNLTSISISFAQTERTDSQRNKSTLQFSFYLFSVHCGREIKISLSLQMGGFSWAMLQSREHFRLCGEQRPACLLTWLRRSVPL